MGSGQRGNGRRGEAALPQVLHRERQSAHWWPGQPEMYHTKGWDRQQQAAHITHMLQHSPVALIQEQGEAH